MIRSLLRISVFFLLAGICCCTGTHIIGRLPAPLTWELINASPIVCTGSTIAVNERFHWPFQELRSRTAHVRVDHTVKGEVGSEILVDFLSGYPATMAWWSSNSTEAGYRDYEAIPANERCLLLLKRTESGRYTLANPATSLLSLAPPLDGDNAVISNDHEFLEGELLRAAISSSPAVSRPAIKALVSLKLQSQKVVRELKRFVHEPEAAILVASQSTTPRSAAIAALIAFGDWEILKEVKQSAERGVYSENEMVEISEGFAGIVDAIDAVPALADLLHSKIVMLRRSAAWTLGNAQLAMALPYLREALKDDDVLVQMSAVYSLHKLAGNRQKPSLPGRDTFLSDPAKYVRIWSDWCDSVRR